MDLTYRVDYLTIVTDEDMASRIGPHYQDGRWLPQKGQWGYDQCWLDTLTGVKRLRSSTRPDMGVCFVATGKVIDKIQHVLREPAQLWALDRYGFGWGRCTRIDLAVDRWDEGESTSLVVDSAEAGLLVSSAKKMHVIRGLGSDTGLTLYVGARTSPRMLRVYNKNSESKGVWPTTRLEIEIKQPYSADIWRTLTSSRSPDVVMRAVIGTIKDLVPMFGVPVIDKMFSGFEPLTPAPREDIEADTKRWLSHQIIPTLVKSVRDNPDRENLLIWLNMEVERRSLLGE